MKEIDVTAKGKDKHTDKTDENKWEVKPVRQLAPGRKAYKRGSLRRIIKHTSTQKALGKAKQEYELDKLAPGSRRSISDRVRFWLRRAESHGIPPWPLTTEKLNLLGALLHAGAYRSAAAYFAAVKRQHVLQGGEWSPTMAQEVRDGVRSCTRGQGPDWQSVELDLDKLANLTTTVPGMDRRWPAAGRDAVLILGLWLLREIEGGTARLSDVRLLPGQGCGRASWHLPCSKTDQRALGHRRVHGCSCPDRACPTAAMRRVMAMATKMAQENGKDLDDAPLIPNLEGDFIKKDHMVAYFQEVGKLLGKKVGVTGHMPRVSGARRMARAGIELWQIQLFARWESAVILWYVREAPLARSHLLANRLRQDRDLNEHIDDTTRTALQDLSLKEGAAWPAVVNQKLEQALGGEVAAEKALQNPKLIQDTVKAIIEEQPSEQDLPEYVVNGRKRPSQALAHRPRDPLWCYCGWGWAEAMQQGVGRALKQDELIGYKVCEICEKGRSRMRPS